MSNQRRSWFNRRQAVDPTIGHTRHDCRLRRCLLKGSEGDALLCAMGFNIRWLLRAIARNGPRTLLCAWRAVWMAIIGTTRRVLTEFISGSSCLKQRA
jgi:transposase, IS5 family